MAPRPNPSESITTPSSTLSSQVPQESQTGLPGLKRGIAIGVAACVAILLIAFLAFFAIRRRKRLSQKPRSDNEAVEAPNAQNWPQEKCQGPSPPPVEADTRTIHEMDANQIPELPSYAHTPEKDSETLDQHQNSSNDNIELYEQDQRREQQWNIILATENNPSQHYANRQLPLLTISPSEGQPGDISPLLRSSWDASSPSPSTGSVSPLVEAHLPSRRFGDV